MAVVTTYGLLAFDYNKKNPTQIADGIDQLGFLQGTVRDGRTFTDFGYGLVTDNTPISLLPATSVVSTKQPSFLEDYYYRIHVNPRVLDLGNLLSTQTRDVEVWNAHFSPKLLSSVVSSGTDGITLAHPVVPPVYYAALESKTYQVNISTNGPPIISALYTFNFPGESPTLGVTGRRVVVWPFMPQVGHGEVLEWKTDILPSFNNEQRLALRTSPRQTFTHNFHLTPSQFSRAKAIATQWSHRVYGIPVWAELTYVGNLTAGATSIFLDTSNADYRADDIILIWENDTKFVAIENLGVLSDRINLKVPLSLSYSGAYVSPLRFARTFSGVDFKRGARDTVISQGAFQVISNKDLGVSVGYPTYRGKDVLVDRSVLSGDISERILRATDEFDNGSGPISVDIKNNWVSSAQSITFDTLTRADRWKVRKWIHSRRGRQKAFWLPSWNRDLTLLQDVGGAGQSLTVSPIGYPLYYGVKDIMIQLLNGTRIYSRILSGSTDGSGNEILSLEAAPGAISVSQVDLICFMSHVRLNSDRVEIKHTNSGRASMSIPVLETPE